MKNALVAATALSVVMCWGTAAAKRECTTIKDGVITHTPGHYLEGQPLAQGYDGYGYNYQAHLFNGSYFNVYSGAAGFPPYEGDDDTYLAENPDAASHWAWPYRGVTLRMKWNDAWLSNMDCVGDGGLDRHYGFSSYIGSGAWTTNHQSGTYEVEIEGEVRKVHWVHFIKIVAVPEDAVLDEGVWYNGDGIEIGPEIWGSFAMIQEVYVDPFAGIHGKQ